MSDSAKTANLLSRSTEGAYRAVRWLWHSVILLYSPIRLLMHMIRNAARRMLHCSDYSRWSNQANLEKWWESRTKLMATLVPRQSKVIEFGAGNCRLRAYLDESCEYIPSDIVDRGPDTVICDLNRRPLPELHYLQADVALFAGVLEYIADVESVMAWLSQYVEFCIVSYDCVPPQLRRPGRLREHFRRQYYGYQSDFTEDQLLELFRSQGFDLTQTESWTTQRIFAFGRERVANSSVPLGTSGIESIAGEVTS